MAESKKRRVDAEDGEGDGEGEGFDREQQRKMAKAQFMTSTMDEQALRNLLIRICCQVPEAADMVEEQVQDDVVMRKLFIRGLSNEATKEQVQEFFERYGNVEDVTIVMDRTTGRSKGYGFVTFQTMEGAFSSLQEPEKEFDGRRLFCNLAAVRDNSKQSASSGPSAAQGGGAPGGDDDVDNRKLFVRGLAYDVTADRLRSLFEEYGEIEDCSVITDKNTGRSKGYGFVTFRTSTGAAAAVERGQKEVDGRTVHIHYASSRTKDGSEQQPPHGSQHGGMYPPMHMRQGMGFPGYNPAMAAQYYHMMAAAPYRMWG